MSGRVLSQSNVSRLKSIFAEIGSILVDAKVLDSQDLKRILDDELGELAEEEAKEVSAGKLSDALACSTWMSNINHALDIFRPWFIGLHQLDDRNFQKKYGANANKQAIALEMIEDLATYLKSYTDIDQLPTPELIAPYSPFFPYMEASSKDESDEDLIFTCEIQEDIQGEIEEESETDIQGSFNKMPFNGVLFMVDEVSENAPSKGSSLPLYVPLQVAEAAAAEINASGGLPLDADDSLAKHANKQIIGIMNQAKIIGNEFWVSGHLFPWNDQEKVSLISANSESLGMSMNAHAKTQIREIDGREVSYIKDLHILGANILYAKRATYQKTKTQIPVETIAASSNLIEGGNTTMDYKEYFASIDSTLSAIAKDTEKQNEVVSQLERRLAQNEAVIADFVRQRQEQESLIAAEANNRNKESERQELISAIAAVISQDRASLKDEILDAVKGRRMPTRPAGGLVDIVAQGSPNNSGLSGTRLELHNAELKLATLREAGVTGSERAKLIEQISGLKSQLMVS